LGVGENSKWNQGQCWKIVKFSKASTAHIIKNCLRISKILLNNSFALSALSKPTPMGGKDCTVCGIVDSKYKCAQCRLPYCCVNCCKKHKEVCVVTGSTIKYVPSQSNKDITSTTNTESIPSSAIILNEHQLSALNNNNDVNRLLRSERLKAHIEAVDTAPDRSLALKKLRLSHPEFDLFVCNMLQVVTASENLSESEDELHKAAREERRREVARLIEEAKQEVLLDVDGQEDDNGEDEELNKDLDRDENDQDSLDGSDSQVEDDVPLAAP
jgi:hypothetical protein